MGEHIHSMMQLCDRGSRTFLHPLAAGDNGPAAANTLAYFCTNSSKGIELTFQMFFVFYQQIDHGDRVDISAPLASALALHDGRIGQGYSRPQAWNSPCTWSGSFTT